jgi:hypothetical protein
MTGGRNIRIHDKIPLLEHTHSINIAYGITNNKPRYCFDKSAPMIPKVL